MGFIETLVATVLGFILREAPNVQRNAELTADFKTDITSTVNMHAQVSDGQLVDNRTDVLILSAVTYRESRFRLPPEDGDCHTEHALLHTPRLQWPKDYVPVWKMNCHAIGPQQLNKSGAQHLPPWKEVQALFPDRNWSTPDGRKKDKLTEAQMRDPLINIKLSYGVLIHWKNECRQKDGADAPVGVWFTAYRQGRCPFLAKTGKYYIDDEAKKRCDLIQKMAEGFSADEYALPQGFRCVYQPASTVGQKVSSL